MPTAQRSAERAGKRHRATDRRDVVTSQPIGADRRVVRLNNGVYLVVHATKGVEHVVMERRRWTVYTSPTVSPSDEAIEVDDAYEVDDAEDGRPDDADESGPEPDRPDDEYEVEDPETDGEAD